MLIGILMPALSGVREQSRRVKCASNLRQYTTAALISAQNNKGYFRLSHRDILDKDRDVKSYPATDSSGNLVPSGHPLESYLTTDDHIAWISAQLAARIKRDSGVDISSLLCPNRAGETSEEWLKVTATLQADGSVTGRTRNGYYFFPGRWEAKYKLTTTNLQPWEPTSGRKLHFPARVNEKAKWLVASDSIEQGTASGLGGKPQTTSSHGRRGFVGSPNNEVPVPNLIGSQGGNFAFLDGSVQWIDQSKLYAFYVNSNGKDGTAPGSGSILGYFPIIK